MLCSLEQALKIMQGGRAKKIIGKLKCNFFLQMQF